MSSLSSAPALGPGPDPIARPMAREPLAVHGRADRVRVEKRK